MESEFKKPDLQPYYPSELIEGCKKGDQKAQLQVYKLYYKPVYNLCISLVHDPHVAEDLMHESFLDAFENINSYLGEVSFPVWIENFITRRPYYEIYEN